MKRIINSIALTGALAAPLFLMPLCSEAQSKGYKVKSESTPGMPPGLVSALAHVKVSPPPASMKAPAKAKVQLVTSKGTVTLELNGKAAPLHVKNFLHLSKIGFYNNTVFHRFADLMGGGQGRIIQGGDPLTKVPTTREYAGMGGPGYQVPREHNSLKHTSMVIAAARSSDPDSAGSQFYLTLDPVAFLDEKPGYTVFGKITGGKDVVMKLKQGDTIKKVVLPKK